MPALQVKDCPDDVYQRLRRCAVEEKRSISQQALTIIEDFLDARDSGKARCGAVNQDAAFSADGVSRFAANRVCRYSNERDETDYLARRREAFARLSKLPSVPVTEKSPSTAEILRQIREEEAR